MNQGRNNSGYKHDDLKSFITMFHDEIIYLACRGQKYATLGMYQNMYYLGYNVIAYFGSRPATKNGDWR